MVHRHVLVDASRDREADHGAWAGSVPSRMPAWRLKAHNPKVLGQILSMKIATKSAATCFSRVVFPGTKQATTFEYFWRKRDRDSNTDSNLVLAPLSLSSQVVLAHLGVVEQLAPGTLEAVAAELQDEAAVRHGQGLLRRLLDDEERPALAVDGDLCADNQPYHTRRERPRRRVDR